MKIARTENPSWVSEMLEAIQPARNRVVHHPAVSDFGSGAVATRMVTACQM